MDQKVKNLLDDWQTSNPALYEIADSVRAKIWQLADAVGEDLVMAPRWQTRTVYWKAKVKAVVI